MKFEYRFFDGSILRGELEGTVQSDPDIVVVDAVYKASFNGVPYPSIETSDLASLSEPDPTVSFSGSLLDILVCPEGFLDGCPRESDSTRGGFMLSAADLEQPNGLAIATGPGGAMSSRMSIDYLTTIRYGNWSLCRVPSEGRCSRAVFPGLGGGKPRLFLDPVLARPIKVTEIRDVVYGQGEIDYSQGSPYPTKDLLLDLYTPVGSALPKKLPGVVWVHGAGSAGDKAFNNHMWMAREFANRGYVTVSINHRLLQDDPPPSLGGDPAVDASIVDTASAVNWMRDHAEELGVDPSRIVVGGHSTGAVAALFVGVIGPPRLAEVAAVVDFSGTLYGLTFLVDSTDPPMFIGHATNDGLVPYANALALAAALTAEGVPYRFPMVCCVNHDLSRVAGYSLDSSDADYRNPTDWRVRDEMFEFLYEQLDLGSLHYGK